MRASPPGPLGGGECTGAGCRYIISASKIVVYAVQRPVATICVEGFIVLGGFLFLFYTRQRIYFIFIVYISVFNKKICYRLKMLVFYDVLNRYTFITIINT